MGIILKQSFKGTIYSYSGVVIGFITTGILFPRILSADQIGLISNLVAYSLLLSQIFSLGFNNVTNRLFPHYRDPDHRHNGYSIILSLVFLFGFSLFSILFPVLKQFIISYNKDNAAIFNHYITFLFPLVFAFMIFSLFDNYLKALYNATFGIFLREFFQRALILISTILLAYNFFNFDIYINIYTGCIIIPAVVILAFLVYSKQFSLKKKYFNVEITKKLKREILVISLFGVLGGLSTIIVMTVDKIMLAHYTGLKDTGIYSIAFYFGTLVLIPSRTLIKISITIISEAWKKNDLDVIRSVYYKSCINQYIIGFILFLGIWVNIDNVIQVVTEDFSSGKYVIFFIGLMNVFDMATGVNGIVISTSKYFRYQTYFNVLLGGLTILTNLYFIPTYGLNGAAIATLISGIIYNTARMLFLKLKYNLQPFNYRFLLVTGIGLILYFLTKQVVRIDNFIIDIIVKSLFLGITYMGIIYFLKLSDDLNKAIDDVLKKLR